MFSFLSPSVPEWAKFFSIKEYKQFISLLDAYLKSKGFTYTVDDGILRITGNPLGMEQLGLINLAQQCKLHSDGDWSVIIRDHFNGMMQAHAFDQQFSQKKHDFEYARDFIAVKLYPDEYFDAVGPQNVIYRPFAASVIEVLIYDMPQTVSNIKPEDAAKWNKDYNELFVIGFENIKKRYPITVTKEKFRDFELWICQADHLFATNMALAPDEISKYSGSKGALVGLPHRHAMFLYPIESLEVVPVINTLIPVIAGMYNEGPGSISKNLYWYWNEKFIHLPYELGDKKLSFRPPAEFVEMITSLGKS